MRSANQVDRVLSVELLDDFATEQVASATWTDHPAWDVVRVTPHEIAHGSIVWNLLLAIDCSDLVKRGDRG